MARFSVTTFGCQMNVHDSERLEQVLRGAGYHALPSDEPQHRADVVILNTCSVREKAEQKLRSEVGRLSALKRQHPDMLLVVAGCMAQQEGKRLIDRFDAIDVVLGPDNIPELPELLADARIGGLPQVRTVFDSDAPQFLTAPPARRDPSGRARATAFVTTMKGCDERCSFCVVPHTRGPERYRPASQIIDEIEALCAQGVREITLLGQTVNSYRDPEGALPRATGDADPDESEFAALLYRIAERVPALARLRYTSPHPRHLTPSLIAAHRELGVLCRHVHLPVQSGSDRMLKRMIRRHSRDEYLARVERLRREVPGVTLSTDVIVGFSGETEEDFAQTLSLCEQVRYVGLFGFKYSVRPHTPAQKLPDDVPEAVKAERLARLFEVSDRTTREHLASLCGTRQRVLVEGPSKARRENLSGRSERNEIVHIAGAADFDLVGEIVEVEIVEAYAHSLLGRLCEAPHAARRADVAARRSLPVVCE